MNAKQLSHQLKLKQWMARIQECRASGMKIMDWCREHNISRDTYYYWFGLVRKEACTAHPEWSEPTPCFAPIPVPSSNSLSSPDPGIVRIIVGNSTVFVDSDTSADTLRMVLQVLSHVE